MNFYRLIEGLDQDSRPDYEADSVTEFTIKKKTIAAIRRMYIELDLSVRDICHLYSFEYRPEYQKLFYKMFGPKGHGHGGSRRTKSKFIN